MHYTVFLQLLQQPGKLTTLSHVNAVGDDSVASTALPANIRLHLHDRHTHQRYLIDSGSVVLETHLFTSAPILFSSNTNNEMIHERQDVMFSTNAMAIEDMVEEVEESSAGAQTSQSTGTLEVTQTIGSVGKRNKTASTNSDLNDLKLERIKSIIDNERKLALLNYEYQKSRS